MALNPKYMAPGEWGIVNKSARTDPRISFGGSMTTGLLGSGGHGGQAPASLPAPTAGASLPSILGWALLGVTLVAAVVAGASASSPAAEQ